MQSDSDSRSNSDATTSGSSDSDVENNHAGRDHWRSRHEQVLVDSAWGAACRRVEKQVWAELVTAAVSELDWERATAAAAAQEAQAARGDSDWKRGTEKRVTRVLGAYDSSGDEGDGGSGSSGDERTARTRKATASSLYRASKAAHGDNDAQLLRPRVAREAEPVDRGAGRAAEQAPSAHTASLAAAAGVPIPVPCRPRGWPREWSSSWVKVHRRRREGLAPQQAADDDLLT